MPPHARRKRAKGRTYYYSDTGKGSESGQPILERLPDFNDMAHFGGSHAPKMGARNRGRGTANTTIRVADMIDCYQRSPHFNGLSENSQAQYNIYLP